MSSASSCKKDGPCKVANLLICFFLLLLSLLLAFHNILTCRYLACEWLLFQFGPGLEVNQASICNYFPIHSNWSVHCIQREPLYNLWCSLQCECLSSINVASVFKWEMMTIEKFLQGTLHENNVSFLPSKLSWAIFHECTSMYMW